MDHTRLLQRPLVHNDNADLGSNITTWFHKGGECDHSGPAQPSEGTLRPGLTVAICTYKRARSLERFLHSLMAQDSMPDRLVIVDASPDDETECIVKNYQAVERLANCLLYFRVSGSLKGITHQRNFALRWVATDLLAF